MTSLWSRLGLALALAGLTTVGAAAIKSEKSAATQKAATHKAAAKPKPLVRTVPAPAFLRDQIDSLGKAFDGRVGIAVRSIDRGWETGWKDNELYPQQSVSKLWVSVTALDAVDRGRVSLDDKVTLDRSDLTVFHQPIRDLVLANGTYTTTLGDLMTRAITTSDNTANDRLMRAVGGASAVRRMIAAKQLGAIHFGNGERALQSKIAGLPWSQAYSIGGAFFEARNALPIATRRAAFNREIASP